MNVPQEGAPAELLERFSCPSLETLFLQLCYKEEESLVRGGERGGGGHHHGRFFLFSTWSISGGITRSIPAAGSIAWSITHSFL